MASSFRSAFSILLAALGFGFALAAGAQAQPAGDGPIILNEPDSQNVPAGTQFTLSVSGWAASYATYQWYLDGVAIPGAFYFEYSVGAASNADAGTYTVTITDAEGNSVTSDDAVVTVLPPFAPAITQSPASQSLAFGSELVLSVLASGTPPLTYQWSLNGTAIPNAANSTYSVINAAASDAGSYTVTVSNAEGSVTSNPAAVSVGTDVIPAFTTQPQSVSIGYGQNATLTAVVSGNEPLTYQWYLNGTPVAYATEPTLWLDSVTGANAGAYTLVATNDAGSTTSATANVTVGAPTAPVIMVQPQSQAVPQNGAAFLSPNISGSGPMTYQWYLNGVALPDSTQSSLYIYSFQAANAGSYTVTATNAVGTVTSAAAVLSVAPASSSTPVFVAQPAGETIAAGSGLDLSVAVQCTATFTLQWYLNGTAIPNATSNYYSLSAADASNAGTYTCVCSTNGGATAITSAAATVTVLAPTAPVINEQPQSQTLNYGDTLELTVIASASPAPTYQWFIDGVAIPNATGQSYEAYEANATFAGSYSVAITNSAGSVTSSPALITVTPAAAPVILESPQSYVYAPGGEYTGDSFYVTASGAELSYQWLFNGVPIPGATSQSYSVYEPGSAQAGGYSVVVSNPAGSVTSAVGILSVAPTVAPAILAEPESTTIGAGSGLDLYVNATEGGYTGVDTYQWYLNGVAISGATSSGYEVWDSTAAQAGSYTVTVSNSAGSATSTAAQVQVDSAPTFTAQPQSVSVSPGGTAAISAVAASSVPVEYQWYFNGVTLSDGPSISGSATATLTLSNVQASAAGSYVCKVTNFVGTTASSPALLTVANVAGPQFTSNPGDQSFAGSGPLSFTASATGTPAPTYQWYLNNVPIPGATGATYTIASSSAADVGVYTIVATNSAGSTSESFSLSMVTLPVFTAQPTSQTAVLGGSASFSAAATGSPAPTYQWYLNGSPIPGATQATYTIAEVAASDAGDYTVNATNPAGASASNTVTLTIVPSLSFSAQPQGQTDPYGSNIFLSATAVSGTSAPTYQWYFDGQAIAGATNPTLFLTSVTYANSGSYTVVALNSGGSLTSQPAFVVVSAQPGEAPTFTLQPAAQVVAAGDSVVFNVSLAGQVSTAHADAVPSSGVTYQWFLNGLAIAGATGPSLLVQDATAANAGTYTCLVTSSTGAVLSNGAQLSVQTTEDDGRLINISALAEDAPGSNVTMGFVSGRGGPSAGEPLLVRVSGPALQEFNVTGFLTDPQLELFNNQTSALVSGNAGWASTLTNQLAVAAVDAQVGAFPLTNVDSADSALVATLASGPYSVQASSRSGLSGKVLAEVYDATAAYTPNVTPRLINVSCLQNIAANGTMTVGFTMGGQTARTVLIRADGPSLTTVGVTGVMPDPTLTLFSGATATQSNAGWGGDAAIAQAAQMEGAFALASNTSLDSAVLVSLAPGLYTVQVSSASGSAGWVLVEVYEVP